LGRFLSVTFVTSKKPQTSLIFWHFYFETVQTIVVAARNLKNLLIRQLKQQLCCR